MCGGCDVVCEWCVVVVVDWFELVCVLLVWYGWVEVLCGVLIVEVD